MKTITMAQRNGMTKAQRGCVRLYNATLKNIEKLKEFEPDNSEFAGYYLPIMYARLEQLHNGIVRHA